MSTNIPPTFYAAVELFGHARIVGQVSEHVLAGQSFLRVTVPDLPAENGQPASTGFDKLYGPGAVYSITPIDEATAQAAIRAMQPRPFQPYELHLPSRVESLMLDEDDEDDY